MRKTLLVVVIAFSSIQLIFAQGTWTPTSAPPVADRYDDIYFLNKDTGWAISLYNGWAQPGQVLRTYNGGSTWQTLVPNSTSLYRDIGFVDAQIGFIGTYKPDYINGDTVCMYKTMDAGNSWSPVTNLNGPKLAGICGMRVINDSTLYATGRFMGPAGFYKTTNKGITWTFKDMSPYAKGLVDIFFFSPDTGIAVGTLGNFNKTQPHFDSCGVVLYTTDGGNTWVQKMRTGRNNEICWKISFPTRQTGYVSIEENSGLVTYPQYLLKTSNGGLNWQEIHYCDDGLLEAQAIGFINDSVGWIGGRNNGAYPSICAYQTNDGGNTWVPNPFMRNPNRFRFLSDTLGYVSGAQIYKLHYSPCQSPATRLNDVTLCYGEIFHFGDLNITQSGYYSNRMQNQNSCDSSVYLKVTVLPSVTHVVGAQICTGTSIDFGGQTFSVSGTYSHMFTSVYGCDSLVSLQLTVANPLETTRYVKLCFADSFRYGGRAYPQGSSFKDTLRAVGGCDSIIQFKISASTWPIYSLPTEYKTACQGDSYLFNGQALSQTGYYRDTLQTIHGCDSIFQLSLNFLPVQNLTIDTAISECNSYTLPSGNVVTLAGTYYDTLVGSNTCDSIITTNLSFAPGVHCIQQSSTDIRIYPNPATNQLSIETNGAEIEQVNIFNTTGSLVSQTKELQNKSIDVSRLATGVYIAEIKTKEGSVRRRWVKM